MREVHVDDYDGEDKKAAEEDDAGGTIFTFSMLSGPTRGFRPVPRIIRYDRIESSSRCGNCSSRSEVGDVSNVSFPCLESQGCHLIPQYLYLFLTL